MLEKVSGVGSGLKDKFAKYAPMVTMLAVTGSQLAYNMVLADGDAQGLAKTILELIGKLIIVLGIFIAGLGIVNFASSHAEGNGGSQDKAVKQIAAGVMVVGLSALLIAYSGDLAGYITLK